MKTIKWILPVFLVLVVRAASAADLDAKITNLDGSPLMDGDKPVELTVRTISINALMTPSKDEQVLSGEEKLKRADLARRILNAKDGSFQMTSEEIALIKKLINHNYPSPLVVDQAWRALEKK